MPNMRTKQTILCLNYFGYNGALAKIIDLQNQIVVAFLENDGDHLTFHRKSDCPRTLLTYHSKNKSQSKSDPIKVDIAKRQGLKHPERHSQYYVHQFLVSERLKMDCVGLRGCNAYISRCLTPCISLNMSIIDSRYPIPGKYIDIPRVTLDTDCYKFMLSVFYTNNIVDFYGLSLIPIETNVGFLSFKLDEAPLF